VPIVRALVTVARSHPHGMRAVADRKLKAMGAVAQPEIGKRGVQEASPVTTVTLQSGWQRSGDPRHRCTSQKGASPVVTASAPPTPLPP